MMALTPKPKETRTDSVIAAIQPANMQRITLRIRGTAPLVQAAFSQKAKDKMLADMATSKAQKKSKAARPPRNYDEDFEQAQHKTAAGMNGIPCAALRNAVIAACRTVNVVMTQAKMAVFVVPDGIDAVDGTPLVRLHGAAPARLQIAVRNDNGSTDIRVRPMWREWWADVTIEFDADMITADSIVNLLDRAGRQVGIGEGRPFSKKSNGMGWGTFTVVTAEEKTA